jgi:hypothetical protein
MAFRFELVSSDRDSVGSIETNEVNWQPGDVVYAYGGRRYRLTAVVPLARIQETGCHVNARGAARARALSTRHIPR